MTFEQLSIFVAVAEREHLTKAAFSIGLTPSAVSSAIRNLETSYGVELFHRVGRRIELTNEGRVFLGRLERRWRAQRRQRSSCPISAACKRVNWWFLQARRLQATGCRRC